MDYKSTEDLLKAVEEAGVKSPEETRVVFVKPKYDHSFDLSSSSSGAHPRPKPVIESAAEVHQPPSPSMNQPQPPTTFGPVTFTEDITSTKKSAQPELKKAKNNENEIIQMSTFSPPTPSVRKATVSQEPRKFSFEEISDISIGNEVGGMGQKPIEPGPSRIPVVLAKERPKSNIEREIEAKIKAGQGHKKSAPEEKDPFVVTSAGRWAVDFDHSPSEPKIDVQPVDVEAKTSEHEKANDESLNESEQKNFNPVARSSFEIQHEKVKATDHYRPKSGRTSRSRERKLRKKSSQPQPTVATKYVNRSKLKPSKSESAQNLIQTATSSSSTGSSGEKGLNDQKKRSSTASSSSSTVSTPPPAKSKSHRKSKSLRQKKSTADESASVSSATQSRATASEVRSEMSPPLGEVMEKKMKTTKFLGVYIHHTSELKFDMKIRDPRVRVSLVDSSTGQLAVFRHKTIKRRQLEQPFIIPQTTKSCKFTSRIAIKCEWEQFLCFHEDINRLEYKNILIFFEILDNFSKTTDSGTEDLYEIAWGFLRPFHGEASVHFNKRLKIQLYSYQKLSKRMKLNENTPVYNQWSLKRKKYPAILEVTVKEVNSLPQDPLGSKDSKNSNNISNEMKTLASTLNVRADIDHLMFLSRTFQTPQSLTLKRRSKKKGCLLVKFSSCGKYLAYTEVAENEHNIYVLSVPDLEICHILRGHSGLIHDLEWHEKYILTASADHSVILWSIDDRLGSLLKIMPHSSYVYCSKVIEGSDRGLYIVTAGRDSLIRLWRCSDRKPSAELLQEVEEHKEYVTAMAVGPKTGTILSGDAKGLIVEWRFDKRRLKRDRVIDVPQFKGRIICDMLLNSTGCKVFIQVDGLWEIFILGLPSGILIQKIDIKAKAASVHQKLSISGCGTCLFCPDATRLIIYDLFKDEVQSEVRVPFAKGGKTFISSSATSMRHQSLAVTVYGPGGGLVVYAPVKAVAGDDSVQSVKGVLKESPVSWKLNENSQFGSHLKQIIQRIDEVFLSQQQKVGGGDEEAGNDLSRKEKLAKGKSFEYSSDFDLDEEDVEEEEEELDDEAEEDEEYRENDNEHLVHNRPHPIPMKRQSLMNLYQKEPRLDRDVEKGGSSAGSGTFVIEKEFKHPITQAQPVKNDSNEVNNRTFSVSIKHEKSKKLNSGTFSIEQPKEKKKSKPKPSNEVNVEDDDTTVSESLH